MDSLLKLPRAVCYARRYFTSDPFCTAYLFVVTGIPIKPSRAEEQSAAQPSNTGWAALADGISFTQETTLSGGYPRKLARRAKEAGYTVRLSYVGGEHPARVPAPHRKPRFKGRA